MGGPLMKRSYLGYDPIIGARYYGIGNEFMGVYIGATLLFISHFLQMKKNGVTFLLPYLFLQGLVLFFYILRLERMRGEQYLRL